MRFTLVMCFTFTQNDIIEITDKYRITRDSFEGVDICHQGFGTFTAITCCYQKEDELMGLQYANESIVTT